MSSTRGGSSAWHENANASQWWSGVDDYLAEIAVHSKQIALEHHTLANIGHVKGGEGVIPSSVVFNRNSRDEVLRHG